ncbi:hypothetical protein GCM10022257_11010 [Hyunsoonleella aestuarii]|uniref:Uncharacterized protein n=1 Tax=Hyunsoonleella aestuarii TaxID=912802 RepID=A0ABP8E9V6_9FLAO
MPFPGNGCNHSNPINENVNFGSIKTRLTQPVNIAPNDSKKHSNPKNIRKTIKAELSICLNKYLFSIMGVYVIKCRFFIAY